MSNNLRNTIIGAWELVEYSIPDKENPENKYYPMGKDVTGFILYTPDGYMSAQMMSKGRPSYASKRLHTGTLEEMAAASKGYMAYSGQYEVDEKNNILTHHMTVSLNPTWEGQAQQRLIQIENNLIIITAPANNATLIWKRADFHEVLKL